MKASEFFAALFDLDDLVQRISNQSKAMHPNAWERRLLRELIDAIEALA